MATVPLAIEHPPVPPQTFGELRRTLRDRGLLERHTGRMLLEMALHVATLVAGAVAVAWAPSPAWAAPGMLLVVLGSLGIATNGHTATHHATSRYRWLDALLTNFSYPFVLQVSASYWRHKHIVRHHPAPNVLGHDDDIDLMPFFAFTKQQAASGGAVARCYHRWQWLVFPLVLAVNGFNVQKDGWIFLLLRLLDREARLRSHWVDLAWLLSHWLVWWLLPMLFFAPGSVVLFNVSRSVFMGYGMFALFAPAHFPAEAHVVEAHRGREDHLLVQTANSVNFRTGPYGRLLCGGVEYQIEHHLFPGASHDLYPKMAPIVREFCERRGYPYRTLGWGEALWKSFLAMRTPKPSEAHTDALRRRLGIAPE